MATPEDDDLFKRDGFTQTTTLMHAGHRVEFRQWESKYVSYLENRCHELERLCAQYQHSIAFQAKMLEDRENAAKPAD